MKIARPTTNNLGKTRPARPSYVVLDFETTGLNPSESEIIEIGALRVEGFEIKDRFNCLVKPKGRIPLAIAQLTGISDDLVAGQKSLEDVLPAFVEFLGDFPIVAHNSQMEAGFLDFHVVPACGRTFTLYNSIEPLALAFPDFPSHAMQSLRRWAGLGSENAHRAFKDCEDVVAVLERAHHEVAENRPQAATIVREVVGSNSVDWWWSWLFEGIGGEGGLNEALGRPRLGDLNDLRERDTGRDIDWGQAVQAEDIHRALTSDQAREAGFQYREAQEKMAQEVREALTHGKRIAIEAPTGTGKSVAYLLPGILAARATGAPLIVSTHSKSLQDQLLEKDIPSVFKLIEAGERPFRATAVKGQENYLCLRKLHDLASTVGRDSPFEERFAIAYLFVLSAVSRVAEIDRVSHYLRTQYPFLGQALEQARSHFTTTVGPGCPFYKSCHFFDSARLAHESEVVIANHALVFQWPGHLPAIRNIVFDEAHHLENQITEAYSVSLKEEQLANNLDRLSRKHGTRRTGDCTQIAVLLRGLTLKNEDGEDPSHRLAELTDTVRSHLLALHNLVPSARGSGSSGRNFDGYEEPIDLTPWPTPGPKRQSRGAEALTQAFANLASAIDALRDYLQAGLDATEGARPRGDTSRDLLAAHAFRFEQFARAVRALVMGPEAAGVFEEPATVELDPDPEAPSDAKKPAVPAGPSALRMLYWNPQETVWRLSVEPIEVGKLAAPFFTARRSVILTSATLSAGPTGVASTFVTGRIGLAPSKPLVIFPSPYELEKQASVFIPHDVDLPGTQGHLDALIGFTEQVTTLLGGRTLLLISSNRRLRVAAEVLREKLKNRGITVLDSLTDRRAADIFRSSERALLIGSEGYGEGIDIPGKALSCVIIEKINEAMTRSPLAEARKARTRFALYDYDFPLRMMWLKQRVGRLIRSPTDTGAIVVFDPRYHGWSGASRNIVNQALAPIPIRSGSREEILFGIQDGYC